MRRSKIAHCTRHDLRRTAGSLMLQAGVPLELVSAVLGHRSTEITRAVYAHLAVEHLRPALDALVTAGETLPSRNHPRRAGKSPHPRQSESSSDVGSCFYPKDALPSI